MARGSTAGARVAAPLAFLVAATIGILLIRSALHADADAPSTPAATATTAAATTAPAMTAAETATRAQTTTPTPEQQQTFYVVEAGDTLGTIAEEHGTTVEALLELNPGIDPVALSIGQRIRVG